MNAALPPIIFVFGLCEDSTKLCRTSGITWKDRFQVRRTEMLAGNLAEHIAEVGRQRQVAAFV